MLYDRWREVARKHRHEFALADAPAGRRWTFEQLANAGESFASEAGDLVFPRGQDAGFILSVLAGWRDRRVVCPLELNQPRPEVDTPPPWCAHLKLTSATTGSARLVAFSEDQLAADPAAIIATMGLRTEWPNLGVISLAHSYGFSNLVLPLLLHGIPLILESAPLPEMIRRAANQHSAITLAGVPALWRAWLDANALSNRVRLAISAGAPLPLSLEREAFGRHGLKIHNFYGSSECGGIAFDRTKTPREDPILAGTPLEGVHLQVADDGCLQVRSAGVASSYWPQSSPALAASVFHTTDLAEIHGGQVRLLGRAADVIHVAGRKVAPESIERVLLGHPLVKAALVLGINRDAPGREEAIGAVVSVDAGVRESELRAYLLERLPAWQAPREWRFVKELAGDGRGKISRASWRERWETLPRGAGE